MAELADAYGSGPYGRKALGVQLPPSAPTSPKAKLILRRTWIATNGSNPCRRRTFNCAEAKLILRQDENATQGSIFICRRTSVEFCPTNLFKVIKLAGFAKEVRKLTACPVPERREWYGVTPFKKIRWRANASTTLSIIRSIMSGVE